MDTQYDVWKKLGTTFKCGCCGRIPHFVDIRDLQNCPHCGHLMNYYETEDGLVPLRPDGSVWQNEVGTMKFDGDEEGFVVVRSVRVG